MQNGNYHHRNPYGQQPNANGLNPNSGIIVDGGAAPHINGDASPNTINVDPYNGNADDLQSQQQPVRNLVCQSYSSFFYFCRRCVHFKAILKLNLFHFCT